MPSNRRPDRFESDEIGLLYEMSTTRPSSFCGRGWRASVVAAAGVALSLSCEILIHTRLDVLGSSSQDPTKVVSMVC